MFDDDFIKIFARALVLVALVVGISTAILSIAAFRLFQILIWFTQ